MKAWGRRNSKGERLSKEKCGPEPEGIPDKVTGGKIKLNPVSMGYTTVRTEMGG
jgi:hypothetical protein